MDDERLEGRLRKVRLSVPRVTFAEVEARARQRRASRPLLRMVVATAAVWLIAWGTQVAVEHGVQGPALPANAAVADHPTSGGENVTPGLLVRRQLLDELAPEAWDTVGPVEPEPPGERATRGTDSAALRRLGYV